MLAKTALRLAAIEALCPSALASAGPWPTIAGNRVYDSRLDPIDVDADLKAIEGKPIVTVYTERDYFKPYGEAKYPAQEFTCELFVEMAIAAIGAVTVETPEGGSETFGEVGAAITDRRREALLDMLDASVCRLLGAKRPGQDSAPSAALYNAVAMETRESESEPQRAERVVKLAMRTRKFTVKLKADDWPTAEDSLEGTIAFTANPMSGAYVWFLSERFKFVAPTPFYAPAATRAEVAIGETLSATVANLLAFLQTSAPLFPILARAKFAVTSRNGDAVTASALPSGRKAGSVRMSSNVAGATWTPVPRKGLDLLPEPLRSVAKALDPASSGFALCCSLAELAPAQVTRDPLSEVRVFVGMHGSVPTRSSGADADVEASALD